MGTTILLLEHQHITTDHFLAGYDQVVKVRDLIRNLESAGWVHRSTRGSHRQFKHPQKPSIVTVAGHPGKDVPIGTLRAILKAAELEGDQDK